MDNLVFWGILLLLSGLILLVRGIFNIDIPVIRTLAGVFMILLGVKLLFGNSLPWPVKTAENEIFFRSETIHAGEKPPQSLQIAFSAVVLHLDRSEHPAEKEEIRINNLFSGSTIYLPADIPISITVDAVFAGVKMPHTNTPLFGRGRFTSDDFDPELPHLAIDANCVFGSVIFLYKQ